MRATIVFIRHELVPSNGPKNCLDQEARDRAFRSGQHLRDMGIVIDVAYSSPQFRAVETLHWQLAGNGDGDVIPLEGTDARLGDAKLGAHPFTSDELKLIQERAAAASITIEAQILHDAEFVDRIKSRGEEGLSAVRDYMNRHHGKTIGICSHGGTRLEAILNQMGAWDGVMFETGGIGIADFSGEVGEFTYLGNVGRGAESTA